MPYIPKIKIDKEDIIYLVVMALVVITALAVTSQVTTKRENKLLKKEINALEEENEVLKGASSIPFEEVENCSDSTGEIYVFYSVYGKFSEAQHKEVMEPEFGDTYKGHKINYVYIGMDFSGEMKEVADMYGVETAPSIGYGCMKRSGSFVLASSEMERKDLISQMSSLIE